MPDQPTHNPPVHYFGGPDDYNDPRYHGPDHDRASGDVDHGGIHQYHGRGDVHGAIPDVHGHTISDHGECVNGCPHPIHHRPNGPLIGLTGDIRSGIIFVPSGRVTHIGRGLIDWSAWQ